MNILWDFCADTPLSDGGGRRGDVLRKAWLEQIFPSVRTRCKPDGTQEGYVDCPDQRKRTISQGCRCDGACAGIADRKTDALKCIDQFAQTRAVCPGLLAVAPGGLMQEIADYSLMYPQLALYYRYTGDAAALLHTMRRRLA